MVRQQEGYRQKSGTMVSCMYRSLDNSPHVRDTQVSYIEHETRSTFTGVEKWPKFIVIVL